MEALLTGPVQLMLALAAAMVAGGVCGFFLRDWIDHRQRRRREQARQALLGHRTASSVTVEAPPLRMAQSPPRIPVGQPHATMGRPAAVPDDPAAGPAAMPAPALATVLIVDDRYELRAVNAACLIGHGYRVIEAADGDAALEAVRRERPDAILLDHSMPNRTGLEVVGELKADPETAGIPIIFMTAHSYGAVGRKAMAAGCASYLPKPCDPGRVLQEVMRHTRGATAGGARA